jgi:hypothetical protein
VPAVRVRVPLNVPVKNDDDPLELPVTVAVARSGPVGSPPVVARIDRVRFGAVPVHPEQNRFISAFCSEPVIPSVKVCPHQFVESRALPEPLSDVFDWSRTVGRESITLFGFEVRSVLFKDPVWKFACTVSVKQLLSAADPREKSWVVIFPSLTDTLEAVPVT